MLEFAGTKKREIGTFVLLVGGLGLGFIVAGEADEEVATESGLRDRQELRSLEENLNQATETVRSRTSDPMLLRDQMAEFRRLNQSTIERTEELRDDLQAAPARPARPAAPAVDGSSTLEEVEAAISSRVTAQRENATDPITLRDGIARLRTEESELFALQEAAALRESTQAPPPRLRSGPAQGESADERELREITNDLRSAVSALREGAGSAIELRDQMVEFRRLNAAQIERQRELESRINNVSPSGATQDNQE